MTRLGGSMGGRLRNLGGGLGAGEATIAERVRQVGILIPFLALFLVLSFSSSTFFTTGNFLNILDQQSAVLLIAAAGTLVLVTGGIDLSVGAIYALAAVTAGHFAQTLDPLWAVLLGVGVGIAVGACNGIITTVLRISPLITTLAMSFVIGGVASLVTGGNLIVVENRAFGDVARTEILGVKSAIWLMAIGVVVIGLLLARTTAGRYMYAAGGNAEAAKLAGVRVNRTRILAFTISGLAAGLAGVIDTSRVLSAQAETGSTLAFTVLAGVVVGGTSIYGGDGAVWRTVVGVLFIALIGNGFNLLGLDPLWKQVALGTLMMAAVGIDSWARKRSG